MRVFRVLLCALVVILLSRVILAQSPILSSIDAPYAKIQGVTQLAGTTYSSATVAYVPVGTQLVVRGSGFGSGGSVTITPYHNYSVP
jgi:hypothetical protein